MAGEYGKPLYNTQGVNVQGFMGIGQGAGPTSGAPLGQRSGAGAGTGGSPENAYKPYVQGVAAKDVGPGGVSGGQSGLSQGARTGVQSQPQHAQSFYNANRFSANPATAGGPPGQQSQQQLAQGTQGHQGYPQAAAADSGFYYGRAPSQQPYWQ